jgi:hypothetical protein
VATVRQRNLGDQLRAAILAVPLIAVPACTGFGPCDPPAATESFWLVGSVDGGLYLPEMGVRGEPSIVVPVLPDGGLDCNTPCDAWRENNQSGGLRSCFEADSDAGALGITCVFDEYECVGGRRPSFLLALKERSRSRSIGAHFAQVARLEAASVRAFSALAGELSDHRAPRSLIDAANFAAKDEIRHTHATSALARRYGARPLRPVFAAAQRGRSLEAIATENATEGCLRETYSALLALWQARHARDGVVAAAMAPIASDELLHAELAWQVAAWAEPRLSKAARDRVESARSAALAELAVEVSNPLPPALTAAVGLPSPAAARALLAAIDLYQ